MNVVLWLAAILLLLAAATWLSWVLLAARRGLSWALRATRWLSWVLLLLVVAVSVVGLGEAILVFQPFEGPVNWVIEHVLGLGDPSEPENLALTAGWVRWLLVGAVILLLVASRVLGRSAWVDVVVGVVALLGITSILEVRKDTEECVKKAPDPCVEPESNPAVFTLRNATALQQVGRDRPVVLLMVKPKYNEQGVLVSHETSRHEATLPGGANRRSKTIRVKIERGADDTRAIAFTSDLEDADLVYVLPKAAE